MSELRYRDNEVPLPGDTVRHYLNSDKYPNVKVLFVDAVSICLGHDGSGYANPANYILVRRGPSGDTGADS